MASAEQQLLNGDPAAFEQLVQQLMSVQNSARQGAEQSFAGLKDTSPEACVVNLITSLRKSSQPDTRTFCAVLLRKVGTAGQRRSYLRSRRFKSLQHRIQPSCCGHLPVRSRGMNGPWEGWKKSCPELCSPRLSPAAGADEG